MEYYCSDCNYSTSRKFSYNKHLNTKKHERKKGKKEKEKEKIYKCENCNKIYKSRTSIWRHKKKCKKKEIPKMVFHLTVDDLSKILGRDITAEDVIKLLN